MPGRGIFIAGTDTGVGKTLVACALLRGLAALDLKAAAMKPVAAGARRHRGIFYNEDVEQLREASTVDVPREVMNPYCFAPPIAPHLAAIEAGQTIRMGVIARCYAQIAARCDLVVVEGVGGLLVPLGPRHDAAEIPRRLDLPLLLVVGLRLGCLNHALLTVEAAERRGLHIAGWIANAIDPLMARRSQNLQTLRKRIPAPLLGALKYTAKPDIGSAAKALDIKRINKAIQE